jgi:hypothetical protein
VQADGQAEAGLGVVVASGDGVSKWPEAEAGLGVVVASGDGVSKWPDSTWWWPGTGAGVVGHRRSVGWRQNSTHGDASGRRH